MNKLKEEDFEVLNNCPWHLDEQYNDFEFLYKDKMNCDIVKCKKCGIVFAHKRLNESGLKKYWDDYLSRVHVHDDELVKKRNEMYQIDFKFIQQYKMNGNVLDIGCGNGSFLDVFKKHGYRCFGVEFGREAAKVAKHSHDIYYGEFPKLNFNEKYDLIIFRGVLQYFPEPINYLDKAISLLNNNGCIFITAQPNMDSFCFKLFKENFNLPVTSADFFGYTENVFTNYFTSKGLLKVGEKYFYEKTPYANMESDILEVAKAIQLKRKNMKIDFKAPAFWGNMMSLIYKFNKNK
ncbi:class I SAM-dependent methyltransferase [Anaerosinus gibii]|uniref:Class I SAM-dependent methyltransferase n=1 Tax=Selenobaculum gibii TaxID=3054208 RepID=A0A9Y2ETS2_9FIRM|nr:class I SAM-dependent methyltransferase [Selenobaculum gbiensis]WIW70385.1 class I SAM-dependent methyltransferase [Selenobaculum gbiensis]